DAHEILIEREGHYRLADPWLVLTMPDSFKPFPDLIDFALTQMKMMANVAAGAEDYWTLAPGDRLVMAQGFAIDPTSSQAPAIAEAMSQEVHAILAAGGHCLELGCGVSGMLLSRLRAYPKLTGVGVDRAQDLLDFAQQQAQELGVSERVQFFAGDVAAVHAPAQFDVVFWSQSFFPEDSRAAAQRVAFESLKPGGILNTRLLPWEPTVLTDDLRSEAGRAYALMQVMTGSWGIAPVATETLIQEITEAGFADVRLVVTSPARRDIVARRPR
ncbi:MAG: class I SAM-dependent methyltransferase, partial [Caldilineaceae bacterium]|nr:class I SAM-dependent methyltransferase [Caldilineaceae bacterium]